MNLIFLQVFNKEKQYIVLNSSYDELIINFQKESDGGNLSTSACRLFTLLNGKSNQKPPI